MSDAEAQAASDPSPEPSQEPAQEPSLEPAPEQVLELAPEAAPGATTESSTESSSESPEDDPADHRFECLSCGFVYDPEEGIKKLKIDAGIPFLELDPASFRCPVCRSKMGAFKDIGPRNKPSGFEENLNFGLGVNRLTPGQKNVLIFGGFALAVAFFLSLYSLR
jgi:rubredoxin